MNRRIKYEGKNYEIRPGLGIRIDDRSVFSASREPNWVVAEIVDCLATQFTCVWTHEEFGETTSFRTYTDIGTTWEPIL